ncbi:hypothetical protein KKA33_02015 [Patescibacteria group bacterium]|nr:hypothetical protein [Patescibacteria group bacterium]
MSALEISTTTPQIGETNVPEDLQQLFHDTGFDLTGMSPEEVLDIVKSFEEGVYDFRNPVRRILRSDIDPPEF